MGRSNTLPVDPPPRIDSTKSSQPPRRSATAGGKLPPQSHKNSFPQISRHHSSSRHKYSSDDSTAPSRSPPRPSALPRMNSVQTRYMNMLLSQDTIPRIHNILASFFLWILLAGFVIFPSTFTTIGDLTDSGIDPLANKTQTQNIVNHVKNIPLLYVASFCTGIGAIGMIWFWHRWHNNVVWLLNRIFLPGCLNGLAGVISTLTNVYSQQSGTWSVTAWATLGVTGGASVICGFLFLIYNFIILGRVKSNHRTEMGNEAENTHEGLVEKLGRKAKEPALEPSSVV